MLFDGLWPHDPRLDPFRDAVWELSRAGHVDAYPTTSVIPMRSLPFFWVKREWLWFQVNWLDGRRDPPGEDYGPGWFTVTELEHGKFEHNLIDDLVFDAKPVDERDRDNLSRLVPLGG